VSNKDYIKTGPLACSPCSYSAYYHHTNPLGAPTQKAGEIHVTATPARKKGSSSADVCVTLACLLLMAVAYVFYLAVGKVVYITRKNTPHSALCSSIRRNLGQKQP